MIGGLKGRLVLKADILNLLTCFPKTGDTTEHLPPSRYGIIEFIILHHICIHGICIGIALHVWFDTELEMIFVIIDGLLLLQFQNLNS